MLFKHTAIQLTIIAILLALLLSACGATGDCPTEPGGLAITVIPATNNATNVCDATVTAINEIGSRVLLQGEASAQNCIFSGLEYTSGQYDVEVHLSGYEVIQITGIELIGPACKQTDNLSELSAQLTISSLSCENGYFDTLGACKTIHECDYPLFEQYQISGLENGSSGWSCVDECGGGSFIKSPGVCESVSLPSAP